MPGTWYLISIVNLQKTGPPAPNNRPQNPLFPSPLIKEPKSGDRTALTFY